MSLLEKAIDALRALKEVREHPGEYLNVEKILVYEAADQIIKESEE